MQKYVAMAAPTKARNAKTTMTAIAQFGTPPPELSLLSVFCSEFCDACARADDTDTRDAEATDETDEADATDDSDDSDATKVAGAAVSISEEHSCQPAADRQHHRLRTNGRESALMGLASSQ